MSPVHSLEAHATRPPASGSQHVAAGRGATDSVTDFVAPLLGKFVRIL